MAEGMNGAEWLARTLAATGTTHVFWVDAVLRRMLVELGTLGVTRVLAHSEKAAAYMADGCARTGTLVAVTAAQSRMPLEKRERLQQVAKKRKLSVNRLIE